MDYSVPNWSRDGKKIIFSLGMRRGKTLPMDADIYIFDIDEGHLQKIIEDPAHDDYGPVYSPDGKFIAYTTSRFIDSEIEYGMVVTREDKSCEWRLPFSGNFDWSPDSTKLVISADDGVYIVDLPVFLGESFINGTGCP